MIHKYETGKKLPSEESLINILTVLNQEQEVKDYLRFQLLLEQTHRDIKKKVNPSKESLPYIVLLITTANYRYNPDLFNNMAQALYPHILEGLPSLPSDLQDIHRKITCSK